MRLYKDTVAKWLSRLLLAAILVSVGWFSIMTIRDYRRESGAARQMLLEKGSVFIRALESGTCVGMGMCMRHVQQQTLLGEMAVQPGVLQFAVVDGHSVIITRSNSAMVGKTLYSPNIPRQLSPGEQGSWRNTEILARDDEKTLALEIYRQFQPMCGPGRHDMARCASNDGQLIAPAQTTSIAFDASDLTATRAREWRNTLIALSALTAALLATVLTFFWYQRYQHSYKEPQDAMKYKEKLPALGRLAAGVVHEIHNPLSSIKGSTKYFTERTPAGGESYELAQAMTKEVDRLNRVVSELLEPVKPVHLTLQQVDLNGVITHSLRLVSRDAASREAQLRFSTNCTLPATQADPDRLTQVLLNLYLNAIHAIGRQGMITVEMNESSSDRAKIAVTDTGEGTAAEQLEAIFTPYYMTKADGAGPGLAVVQNIIEQHGGTIQVASVEGKGATFALRLSTKARRQD